MRKCALILIIAALFLFSGCNLIHFGGSKPTPSAVTSVPKPSQSPKPSASVKPSPSPEEASAKPSSSNGGHLFGGGGTASPSAETVTASAEQAVQDADIQVYRDESLSSVDDIVYTENASVRADYDGDGKKDILKIDFSYDYPQSDNMNYPVKITLTIGGSSVTYEDTWNDGVSVGISDFDTSDAELDIYIISLGTDVSAYVTTYWYDGKIIEEFTSFEIIEETTFWYDTQGYLYYRGIYEDAYGVMVGLNFYTGEVFTVE